MDNVSKSAVRLKQLREQAGVSVRDMADAVGMSPSSYGHYESRFKRPFLPADFAQQVADALEAKGVDRAEVMALAGASADYPVPVKADAPGKDLIPVYDVQVSAGFGAVVDYESIAYSLAFPKDYISRITKANPRDLSIISVKGDSMKPTLEDDDLVMVDHSKMSLSYDGMFVLQFEETLHVKRVGRSDRPGFVLIMSDNDKYRDQHWPMEEITVVGRVIWKGGKV